MKSFVRPNGHCDPLLRNCNDADNLFAGSWLNAFDNNELSSIDVIEQDNCFYIIISAPALKKEDFNVSVENNVITISAINKVEVADTSYSTKSFVHNFHLPGSIQQQLISAGHKNEMLIISLPKLVAVLKKDVPVD